MGSLAINSSASFAELADYLSRSAEIGEHTIEQPLKPIDDFAIRRRHASITSNIHEPP